MGVRSWQLVAALSPIGALFLMLADLAREARRDGEDICRWEDDGGPPRSEYDSAGQHTHYWGKKCSGNPECRCECTTCRLISMPLIADPQPSDAWIKQAYPKNKS